MFNFSHLRCRYMKQGFSIFLTKHWAALPASVAACTFIYYYTLHSGIGISPDSVMYQTTAVNIQSHFSFTDFNGLPTVDFPLGYPSFLALFTWITGLTVLQVVPLLNGLLFSGVIILTSIIIEGYQQRSSLYKVLILAALACSPCLLEVYSMLWSETLFIFLGLLFAAAYRSYLRSHRTIQLFWVACIVAIAFVTRYAGITLLAAGGFLVLFDGELAIGKKIKHIILFVLVGSSLVVANLMRNNHVAGNATGVREKAIRSLMENLNQIGSTLSDWLPFIKGHEALATVIFILILLLGIVQLFYRTLQQQYYASYETIIACLFVIYALFMIAIATISRFENLSSRLLSPMYIPLLLVGSSWLINSIRQAYRIKKTALVLAGLLCYAGFQYNQYRLNAEAWEGIKDAGIPGYTEDPWVSSPTMAFIKKNKSFFSTPVYSNANDGVYFLSGVHALALPHREIQSEIEALLQKNTFWLVWLNDGENPDLISLEFIKQHKTMISKQIMDDGAIYLFSNLRP